MQPHTLECVGNQRDDDFTPAEAERVRALLRELRDERFDGVNARLGKALKMSGQSLSQSLRPKNPTVPRFSTARKAARLAGHADVWPLLWPELGAAEKRSHFDVAAEVARREGWSEEMIAELEKEAVFDTARTPMQWLDIMRGAQAKQAPPVVKERVRMHEDHVPEQTFETFGERLKYLRIKAKMSTKTLARKAGVAEGDIKGLERGARLGTPETWDKLRRAFGVDADWFGTPMDAPRVHDITREAAAGGRRA